jgi:hypothetical protein
LSFAFFALKLFLAKAFLDESRIGTIRLRALPYILRMLEVMLDNNLVKSVDLESPRMCPVTLVLGNDFHEHIIHPLSHRTLVAGTSDLRYRVLQLLLGLLYDPA